MHDRGHLVRAILAVYQRGAVPLNDRFRRKRDRVVRHRQWRRRRSVFDYLDDRVRTQVGEIGDL